MPADRTRVHPVLLPDEEVGELQATSAQTEHEEEQEGPSEVTGLSMLAFLFLAPFTHRLIERVMVGFCFVLTPSLPQPVKFLG